MTGVGGRPEIVIEGSNDYQLGPWKVCFYLFTFCFSLLNDQSLSRKIYINYHLYQYFSSMLYSYM